MTNNNKNNSGQKKNNSNKNNLKENFDWGRASKTSFIWLFIIFGAVYISGLLNNAGKKEVEIEYTQYRKYLENGDIQKGVIMGDVFHGEFKLPQSIETPIGTKLDDVTNFKLTLPFIDRENTQEWDQAGLEYTFKEKTIDWTGYLLNMLPWILLLGFWFFMIRRMQGGAGGVGGIFKFGKSRAALWTSDQPRVTFKDVAGCMEAKEELKEVIDFLKSPKRFQKLGAKVPKGALLVGPPGTGKTLLARAIAGEAAVPFYSLSGADFVEMFVGVGASRVRDLFEQAKKSSPCIVFIDEMDAVGRQRGAGIGGGHDEREQTLNALLVEMDGFDNSQNVIVIAATNRPDVLDPALLRPGRFDRQIVVDVPDVKGRLGILKVHTKKVIVNHRKVDLESLAKGTPGMVGADIANIVNEAALLAARKKKTSIDMDDWKSNTVYKGEYETKRDKHKVVKWFWKAAAEYSQEQRARLLQFITGTSRVPVQGFQGLQGNDGTLRPFTIDSVALSISRFPRAHTCFNRIDLPLYDSEEDLRLCLDGAIQMECFGFGME